MGAIYKSDEGERLVKERYQAVLNQWPVPNDKRRVETREGETFVIACGPKNAPPVVLLHGSAFNSATWMGDVAAWSEHFRLYAVDVIGHPGFSAPSRPPYGTDAHALWLDDLLNGLGIERAAFVGLSLGGWLAIDYASRRPERVTSLVLLAPGGVGHELTSMAKIVFVILPLMMLGKWGRAKAKHMILGPMPATDSLGAKALNDFVSLINRNFRQRLDKVARFSDETLRRLTMPVLLIVGALDPMLNSEETKARLEQHVPRLETITLPDVGHTVVGQTLPILDFLRRSLGV
jgi:pimeloyl-ACP methyl ester carboxylesterase